MRRTILWGALLASVAGLYLAAAPVASADIPGTSWTPGCFVDTNTPYTNNGIVGGNGGVVCYAFYHDWAAVWQLKVCLQQYIKVDNVWSSVMCLRDWSTFDQPRHSGWLYPTDWCKYYGISEFRTRADMSWWHDGYWDPKVDISPLSWNCLGS